MSTCRINTLTIGGKNNGPAIMAVINISPESFYKPSFVNQPDLHERAWDMVHQGAAIIDIGARSTAPGSRPIDLPTERCRVTEALRTLDGTGITISVDTMYPEVLEACLDFDIHALNDIRGLADPILANMASEAGIPVIAMASCDTPGDATCLAEIHRNIRLTLDRAQRAGIGQLVLDPGIGIWNNNRTPELDWDICRSFPDFLRYGRPLLGAVSRKTFIGSLLGREPEERLVGTLAVTADLVKKGAAIIRAHDIAQTRDLIEVNKKLGYQ
jgi:dihydropteroate synthase